jgi:hypothetical protein
MRWALLLVVPLIVLAMVVRSALLMPVIGIVTLVIAAWVLKARRWQRDLGRSGWSWRGHGP